jgi:hypothetical protein
MIDKIAWHTSNCANTRQKLLWWHTVRLSWESQACCASYSYNLLWTYFFELSWCRPQLRVWEWWMLSQQCSIWQWLSRHESYWNHNWQHRPSTKSRCQKVRPAKRGMRYARRGMRYADRGMRYAEKAMKVSKADLLKEVWEWRWCTGARLLCTTAATQTPAALRSSAPEASWIWGSLHLWQQG